MANKIPRQISSKPNTEMNLKFYRQKTLIECSILEFQSRIKISRNQTLNKERTSFSCAALWSYQLKYNWILLKVWHIRDAQIVCLYMILYLNTWVTWDSCRVDRTNTLYSFWICSLHFAVNYILS